MLNNTVVVGRIVRNPELKETETGRKVANITLAVPRAYKNIEGEYETDYIPCVLWSGIAENTVNYCKSGDLVGVKGRIQSRSYENDKGEKKYVTEIIASNVQFLESKKDDSKFESMPEPPAPKEQELDPFQQFGEMEETIPDSELPF